MAHADSSRAEPGGNGAEGTEADAQGFVELTLDPPLPVDDPKEYDRPFSLRRPPLRPAAPLPAEPDVDAPRPAGAPDAPLPSRDPLKRSAPTMQVGEEELLDFGVLFQAADALTEDPEVSRDAFFAVDDLQVALDAEHDPGPRSGAKGKTRRRGARWGKGWRDRRRERARELAALFAEEDSLEHIGMLPEDREAGGAPSQAPNPLAVAMLVAALAFNVTLGLSLWKWGGLGGQPSDWEPAPQPAAAAAPAPMDFETIRSIASPGGPLHHSAGGHGSFTVGLRAADEALAAGDYELARARAFALLAGADRYAIEAREIGDAQLLIARAFDRQSRAGGKR